MTMTPEAKLTMMRATMNAIDGRLMRELERRFELSDQIIAHKETMGLPIFDRDREAYIIGVAGPDERVRSVYRAILVVAKEEHYGQLTRSRP